MNAQQAVGDGVNNDFDQAVPFAQAKSPAVLAERSALIDLAQTVFEHYNPIAELLATMDKPVIAAVNGVAAGAGAAFAMACDARVFSEAAIAARPSAYALWASSLPPVTSPAA